MNPHQRQRKQILLGEQDEDLPRHKGEIAYGKQTKAYLRRKEDEK